MTDGWGGQNECKFLREYRKIAQARKQTNKTRQKRTRSRIIYCSA